MYTTQQDDLDTCNSQWQPEQTSANPCLLGDLLQAGHSGCYLSAPRPCELAWLLSAVMPGLQGPAQPSASGLLPSWALGVQTSFHWMGRACGLLWRAWPRDGAHPQPYPGRQPFADPGCHLASR
jgi:hypothetical protein